MIIMQFTGLLSVHFTSFSFLFFQKPACFTGHENPPNKCAKITRRNDPPEKSAMATCWIHTQPKPAEFTRRKDLPFQLAACLPEIPLPAQNPQARPGPPSLPPPGQFRQRSKWEGAGSRPGNPHILNRYFYFHSLFMNGFISLHDTTHTYSIQSGLI
jgi:hypothetical protein